MSRDGGHDILPRQEKIFAARENLSVKQQQQKRTKETRTNSLSTS
jgi:hypothetical protein